MPVRPPLTHVCPPGTSWVLLPFPGHCSCPAGSSWSSAQNKCVQSPHYGTPFQTAVPLTKGRRYRKVITSSTGVLPPAYRAMTIASYQATVDAAKWKVISVTYDPTGEKTLTIIADYCGPPSSVTSPDSTSVGGMVVLHGAWSNISPAAASSCTSTGATQQHGSGAGSTQTQAPAAQSSNTGTYIAIGAGALVVVGGIALAMSSKKKKRR
jgi:hypothetical protein